MKVDMRPHSEAGAILSKRFTERLGLTMLHKQLLNENHQMMVLPKYYFILLDFFASHHDKSSM